MAEGFGVGPKSFFYYDPVDIFSSSSLVIKLFHFHFRTDLFFPLKAAIYFNSCRVQIIYFTDRLLALNC